MSAYGPDHGNDSNGLECLNFTTQTADVVLRVKLSLGIITVVLNLLAILLILVSKKFKDMTFRLVIYLMVTDVLQAVAICLAVIPVTVPDEAHPAQVRNGTVWQVFCTATGFLLMTTMWMGNIVIIWILSHLLLLGWRLNRAVVKVDGKHKSRIEQMCSKQVNWEKWGIIFLIVAPFVIGFIPFSLQPDMYGISGLWCWIKVINANQHCGDLERLTLTVALVFFYAPLVLIVLFSLLAMTITIVLVCYGAVRRGGQTLIDEHQRRMKEIIIVLAYPMLYCTVCLLLLANRIYSLAHPSNAPFVPLWITHAVADPVRVMLPAVAFLLHPYIWRDLCLKRPSFSVSDPLKINSPEGNSNINGESMEDKLLTTHDNGHSPDYGSCDDRRYLSSVVELPK